MVVNRIGVTRSRKWQFCVCERKQVTMQHENSSMVCRCIPNIPTYRVSRDMALPVSEEQGSFVPTLLSLWPWLCRSFVRSCLRPCVVLHLLCSLVGCVSSIVHSDRQAAFVARSVNVPRSSSRVSCAPSPGLAHFKNGLGPCHLSAVSSKAWTVVTYSTQSGSSNPPGYRIEDSRLRQDTPFSF